MGLGREVSGCKTLKGIPLAGTAVPVRLVLGGGLCIAWFNYLMLFFSYFVSPRSIVGAILPQAAISVGFLLGTLALGLAPRVLLKARRLRIVVFVSGVIGFAANMAIGLGVGVGYPAVVYAQFAVLGFATSCISIPYWRAYCRYPRFVAACIVASVSGVSVVVVGIAIAAHAFATTVLPQVVLSVCFLVSAVCLLLFLPPSDGEGLALVFLGAASASALAGEQVEPTVSAAGGESAGPCCLRTWVFCAVRGRRTCASLGATREHDGGVFADGVCLWNDVWRACRRVDRSRLCRR